MPTKFKPSQVVRNRETGKYETNNYFIKGTPKEELFEYINNDSGKPKIKQKCRNELVRRGIKIEYVPATGS
jgi:hypothetical protein